MSTFDCGVTQRLLATDKAHGKQSEWREPYPEHPNSLARWPLLVTARKRAAR